MLPGLLEDHAEDAFDIAARLPSIEGSAGNGAAPAAGPTGEGSFRPPSLGADLAALFPTLSSVEARPLLLTWPSLSASLCECKPTQLGALHAGWRPGRASWLVLCLRHTILLMHDGQCMQLLCSCGVSFADVSSHTRCRASGC